MTELALGRLLYPRELSEKFWEHYLEYVRENWKTAGKLLIQADRMQRNRVSNLEPGKLPWLVDEVLDQTSTNLADQLGELTGLAQEAGDTEMVSWLMERRYRLRTAGALQNIGGTQTAEAVLPADAVQGTDRSRFASGNPEIPGESQRPKRKRRFEL